MPKKIPGAKNHTARIGDLFNDEMEKIITARVMSGIDKKRKSIRRLTNLITKHNSWDIIKNDLMEVKLDAGKDDE